MYKDDNPIPLDSIYLMNKFLVVGNHFSEVKYFNVESFKLWWSNRKIAPPIELFLKNFNLEHLRLDLTQSKNDSIIHFNKLNNYFHPADEEYQKEYPKKQYLSISKPFFNCNKD